MVKRDFWLRKYLWRSRKDLFFGSQGSFQKLQNHGQQNHLKIQMRGNIAAQIKGDLMVMDARGGR